MTVDKVINRGDTENAEKKFRLGTMKILRQKYISCFLIFILLNGSGLICKSVYKKQAGNREIEIEADPYYTSLDYYLPLTGTPIPYSEETSEMNIYKKMLSSPSPRFLVFELSTYPLPCLGAFVKKQFPEFYESADITKNLNAVKSITTGFEEPYAVSVFLGDVVSFKPGASEEGKGYTGLLASFGNYHIKDNELITDNWTEGEVKIKGDKTNPENKVSWSMRVGTKLHNHKDIKDALYFAVRRDRTDFSDTEPSIFKNSNFEYILDIAAKGADIIRHYFLVGKKYPMKKSKIVLSISTGFVWEGEDKYTGMLKRTDETENFQILFRPNVEF